MTATHDHVDTVSRAVACLNAGDVDTYIATLYAPDSRFYGFPPAFSPDREVISASFHALVAAVPDATITPLDVLTDGDRLAIRYLLGGTHRGEFMGSAGNGGALTVEGMTVLRFEGAQCVERWNRLDDLTLLAQLGASSAATSP